MCDCDCDYDDITDPVQEFIVDDCYDDVKNENYATVDSLIRKRRLDLGLCCINERLRNNKPSIYTSRTCIRKNFTVHNSIILAKQNVLDIIKLLEWNVNNNIKCLRISSNILPHFTDDKVESYDISCILNECVEVGNYVKCIGHRILMHPGQYVQVGAKDKNIFEKSVKDLKMHADILDMMNIPVTEGVIIVHGGGVYNDKESTIKRWIDNFDKLPDNVKSRLVIENDERQYNVHDVILISKKCNIPVVFDFHHHQCWNIIYKDTDKYIDTPIDHILDLCASTWQNFNPVMHISNQKIGNRIGSHSDYITHLPKCLIEWLLKNSKYNISLEIEAKAKESAILRLYEKYLITKKIKLKASTTKH